jgi:hypothetical protein
LLTLMDVQTLQRDLESHIGGDVRFDKVSLARFIRPNCFTP